MYDVKLSDMRTHRYIVDKDIMEKEKIDCGEIPDEITLEYFSNLVKQMRHQQRRYFATRNSDILKESKRLERQVDAIIAKMFDTQMKLF